MSDGSYAEYARTVLAGYQNRSLTERNLLFAAVEDRPIKRILDLGCGPGQELLPFLENSEAKCVGVDIAAELGSVTGPFFHSKGSWRTSKICPSDGGGLAVCR